MQSIALKYPADSQNFGSLSFWILTPSVILLPRGEDEWVVDMWRRVVADPSLKWCEVLAQCKRVMWIDCIHDELGARAYDMFVSGGRSLS